MLINSLHVIKNFILIGDVLHGLEFVNYSSEVVGRLTIFAVWPVSKNTLSSLVSHCRNVSSASCQGMLGEGPRLPAHCL